MSDFVSSSSSRSITRVQILYCYCTYIISLAKYMASGRQCEGSIYISERCCFMVLCSDFICSFAFVPEIGFNLNSLCLILKVSSASQLSVLFAQQFVRESHSGDGDIRRGTLSGVKKSKNQFNQPTNQVCQSRHQRLI